MRQQRQQLSLGGFVFSQQGEFAYENLERKSGGGWQPIEILNAKPRAHNTGQPGETIRITGKAFYSFGMARLNELRALQGERRPLTIVDGQGRNWGRWQFEDLQETQSRVIDDGTAMLIRWEIRLTEYPDDAADATGAQPGG